MCYTTTQYHTPCQHYGPPLVHGEPCIRALAASGHRSRGCWDATDLGVESVGSLCPGCAKAMMLLSGPATSSLCSSTTTTTTTTMGSESEDYFVGGAGAVGLQKVGSESSLSSMGSRSSTGSGSSSSSSSSVAPTTTTRSAGGKNLEPPNLHWRTFGGSQVSVRFKRNVSAPAGPV